MVLSWKASTNATLGTSDFFVEQDARENAAASKQRRGFINKV
jgi:hypothetical protein